MQGIMPVGLMLGIQGRSEKVLSDLELFNQKMGRLLVPKSIDSLSELASLGIVDRMSVEFARFVLRVHLLESLERKDKEVLSEKSCAELEAMALAAFLAADAIRNSHSCLLLQPHALLDALDASGGQELLKAFAILLQLYAIENDHVWNTRKFSSKEKVLEELLDRLKGVLACSPAVGSPNQIRPLVLDGNRLYIHKYWSYERRLAERFLRLAGERPSFLSENNDDSIKSALKMVKRLFPKADKTGPDWQKIAALRCLMSKLVVVSGGPGTGKTRTVTAMMAVIQAACLYGKGPVSIGLCAPTGKAAARLTQSVNATMAELYLPEEIKKTLPREACTLHRLLGAGRAPGLFRHHREAPLPYQLVIVDEASMVDLPIFAHLLDALAEECSLILLGDKDQLASVEAGSVLRDLCLGAELANFSKSPVQANEIAAKDIGSGLGKESLAIDKPLDFITSRKKLRKCIVVLSHNYRFKKGSGLSELAQAINRGDFAETFSVLASPDLPDVSFVNSSDKPLDQLLKEVAKEWLMKITRAETPKEALHILNKFKVLCALKQSASGADTLNSFIDAMLRKDVGPHQSSLYKGKAVVINRNDYQVGLYNGDTGICWPDKKGSLAVWFEDGSGKLRKFFPSRLPSFDTAWAMTVHRSQGSEFDKVLVVLPPATSTMAGRELLYTAVTRARKKVIIWGRPEDVEACVRQKTLRHSGLGRLLWAVE